MPHANPPVVPAPNLVIPPDSWTGDDYHRVTILCQGCNIPGTMIGLILEVGRALNGPVTYDASFRSGIRSSVSRLLYP
jgi:hypothetical protein